MSDAAIRLRGLTKLFGSDAGVVAERMRDPEERPALIERYRTRLALRDVDLDVAKGHIQVIMGLSGSGKSTLVRHINRLIEPTSGSVEVDGVDMLGLPERELREVRRRKISMVFQRFALLPHRTVEENVAYGLKAAGVGRAERVERARRWIERVGLAGQETRYPAQLSGGMQQRVGLARALATDADIMLMDEAFSALDPLIRTDMQSLLLDLQGELGRTIVFITHDLDEALRLGDRIAILKDGELVREGTGQEIVLDPQSDYVAAFVGDVDQGRIVEIGALPGLVVPAEGTIAPPGFTLPATTRLREAARRLSDGPADSAAVVDGAGRAIGIVSLDAVVTALTRPSRLERDTLRRLGQTRT
ncbi:betaine/proline/choline family ABC transporter ATP-binding protein [Aureimonas mangrovi]|uniref:betaine/proline/choline family ABC transporter ATP-binding protein n=1 Tax=Aureimonas mangrovi TaxID=2758041 RepID=UPI00163DCA2A|nr:betaine/proline/choline family ABC transporter ATP-binding protein [Aureimonas mangrovi]